MVPGKSYSRLKVQFDFPGKRSYTHIFTRETTNLFSSHALSFYYLSIRYAVYDGITEEQNTEAWSRDIRECFGRYGFKAKKRFEKLLQKLGYAPENFINHLITEQKYHAYEGKVDVKFQWVRIRN